MAISQYRSKRQSTGSKYISSRKKRKYELGRSPTMTSLGKKRMKQLRVLGGNRKEFLLGAEIANVIDPKDNKSYKLKIENIVGNEANRNYVRRNILTKGTVIKTEKGNAKVTSRPGQEGTVNAVLIEEWGKVKWKELHQWEKNQEKKHT